MHDRDKRTANYLLLIFGGLALLLLIFRATGKAQVVRAALSYLLNPMPYYGSRAVERAANLPADAARLIAGDIELRQARRELKETAYLRAELATLRVENERLRGELGLRPPAGVALRWARVMRRDPLEWHRSLMVDAGAEDGLAVSAPVLGLRDGELGVVGRVTEVDARTAKVLLLTDDLSSVAAHIPGPGWEGLAQGQGGPVLRVDYLPLSAALEVGQQVYTSPTSPTFPTGLWIGTISKVLTADPFLAFQSAELEPAVRASELKEVLILVPKPGGES